MAFTICARIGVSLIHGRARYPQGRGKIERFNQTCLNDLLRAIAQDPLADPDCKALEHRINHYISAMYNLRPEKWPILGCFRATRQHDKELNG